MQINDYEWLRTMAHPTCVLSEVAEDYSRAEVALRQESLADIEKVVSNCARLCGGICLWEVGVNEVSVTDTLTKQGDIL